MIKLSFLTAVAVSIWPSLASAEPMTFERVSNGGNCYIGCNWTVAKGEITANTPNDFQKFLSSSGSGPIFFNSSGGDFEAAMRLARMIRDADLDTMVGTSQPYYESLHEPVEGGICTNACAVAFLGGANRLIGLRTFNNEFDGLLSFERPGNSEILASLTEETLSGNDLLNEQISVGLFVNFLLEMGISSELYAELSRLPVGASLTIGPELAQSLNIATSDQTSSEWALFQLDTGLALKTRGSDQADGLWAFCSGDKYFLARAYSRADSEGNPCSDEFCFPSNNTTAVFEGATAVVGGTEFPIKLVDVLSQQDDPEVLVLTEVTRNLMLSLPSATGISLRPRVESRASTGNAGVFQWEWGAAFDDRLITLALRNCID